MDSGKTRRTDKGQCGVTDPILLSHFVGGYHLDLNCFLREKSFLFLWPNIFFKWKSNFYIFFTWNAAVFFGTIEMYVRERTFLPPFWNLQLGLFVMLLVLNSESCFHVQIAELTIHTVHLLQCTSAVHNRLLWFKRHGILQQSIDI